MRFCLAKQPNINVSCIKREVLLEEIIAGLSGCRIPCRGMTYHKKTPIKGGVNVHMHEGCALKIFYRQKGKSKVHAEGRYFQFDTGQTYAKQINIGWYDERVRVANF